MEGYLNIERQTLYLDGPNDVDWVFRNDILRRREDSIYVDYVAYKDNFRDEHRWQFPNRLLMELDLGHRKPRILDLALAFRRSGMTSDQALGQIAAMWRGIDVSSLKWPELRRLNIETIEMLETKKLLRRGWRSASTRITGDWLFPLYSLDLGELKISPADLEMRQRRWTPDAGY